MRQESQSAGVIRNQWLTLLKIDDSFLNSQAGNSKVANFSSIEQTHDILFCHPLSWCIVSFFIFFSLCSTHMLRHVLLTPGFAVSHYPVSITKALTLESAVPWSLLYSLPVCSNLNLSFTFYKPWKQNKTNQQYQQHSASEGHSIFFCEGRLEALK